MFCVIFEYREGTLRLLSWHEPWPKRVKPFGIGGLILKILRASLVEVVVVVVLLLVLCEGTHWYAHVENPVHLVSPLAKKPQPVKLLHIASHAPNPAVNPSFPSRFKSKIVEFP